MNTQSTPGKIDHAQKQYQDTCMGEALKHACRLIDTAINTKVSQYCPSLLVAEIYQNQHIMQTEGCPIWLLDKLQCGEK